MNDNQNLSSDETSLIGHWVLEKGKVIEDSVATRIQLLINNRLKKITTADLGWSNLFVDPQDNRFWELYYPHSEMHGGGPPALRLISAKDAIEKYGLADEYLA